MKNFYKLTNHSCVNHFERNFNSAREVVDFIKDHPNTFATGFHIENGHIGNGVKAYLTVADRDNRVAGHELEITFPCRTETAKAFFELVNLPHPVTPEFDKRDRIRS
jgi:hypothetical protein